MVHNMDPVAALYIDYIQVAILSFDNFFTKYLNIWTNRCHTFLFVGEVCPSVLARDGCRLQQWANWLGLFLFAAFKT